MDILMSLVFTVFVFAILIFLGFGIYTGIEKINNNKQLKKDKENEAQGIEKRWAVMGHGFYIIKTRDNEIFYLNKDENFYNTTTNIKEFNFDTRDEVGDYIESNKENMKTKYGQDINFKIYTKQIYLGYCKQLEEE